MKKLLWTGLILGAAAGGAVAQDYIYVTNRSGGANGVSVFKQAPTAANPPILVRTLNDPSFNGANSIAALPSIRQLFVTNSAANPGTVTIVDGDTLAVVGAIPVPGSQNLTGISASADGQSIFVAGENPTPGTGGPTVWQINVFTGVATVAGAVVDPGNTALDCAVIEAGAVGGAGSAPGKLYFSVPNSGAGYVAIVNFLTGGTTTVVNFNAGGLAAVNAPARMDRSPDHSVVMVACGNLNVGTGLPNNFLHLVTIATATDTLTDVPLVNNVANNVYTTLDVSFRPESAPIMAYVLGNNNGALAAYFVNSAGAPQAAVVAPGAPPAAGTLNHHLDSLGNDFFYYGDSTGNSANIGRFNVAAWPGTPLAAGTSGANGTTKFAFMAMPLAPFIFETSPKGDVNQANNLITVTGANFVPASIIQLPGPAAGAPTFITLPTTFVNSETLQGTTVAGLLTGEQDVFVVNPDAQTAILHQFYTTCGPALTPWTKNLPAPSGGYLIFSAPQYSSVSSLTAALESSLGPYNPYFYRVFFWKGGQYVELNQMTNDNDLSGRAFWALTRNGGSFTLSGLDCFANAVSGTRVVPLDPGWNMISLPYQSGALLGMNWTNVQVTADGAAWSGAGPADGTPALLNPLLYVFLNGNYVTVNQLVAGDGYFVFNPTGAEVYLLFNSAQLVVPPVIPYAARRPLAAGTPGPPGPPAQDSPAGGSGGPGGCGLLGPELLPLALAFHHLGRRRRLRA